MNYEFLDDIDRSIRILEVGANTGVQLVLLQKMGFTNLYGIELQDYPIKLCKTLGYNVSLVQASAFHIPFRDRAFELVFTSGVLIHIAPSDIARVMEEIYRCTKSYIWGFEYYAESFTEIPYRGHQEILYKGDYVEAYLKRFQDLQIVRQKKYKYLENNNVDCMFLLEKVQS